MKRFTDAKFVKDVEYKLEQLLWKSTQQFHVKLKMSILCSPRKGLEHAYKSYMYKNVHSSTDCKKLETS